ncbi:hypothetical protein SDC9_191879 [bioreactor metagenome]|uniref:Uncharacterized protein n=1 Tax=bioreactor metagenome TaxID=1076179 RepID=A0A645HZ64_9ZZZZ
MFFQMHQFQHLFYLGLHLSFRHLAYFQPEPNILPDGQVGEQGVRLEHHTHITGIRRFIGYVFTVKRNGAGAGHFKACDHTQRGGLATSRRSEEGDKLSLFHIQVEIFHRDRRSEDFGNIS